MKKTNALAAIVLLVSIVLSCGKKNTIESNPLTDAGTRTYTYSDSCQHLRFSLSLELPLGTDSASLQIRDSLIVDFIRNVSQPGYSEEQDPQIASFHGDNDDPQALVNYYGKAGYDRLLQMALSDYNERMQYLDEDTTMTVEEKQQIKNDVPMWEYNLTIAKTTDTEKYVVYQSQTYCYYGGAHGGVTGTGPITFLKSNGHKVDHFISPDATEALQPLLRKGLLRYYADCGEPLTDAQLSERLQIEGTIIPLPRQSVCPDATADSLIFTYQQYEIACYADGMPSFTIAISDIESIIPEFDVTPILSEK